MLTDALGVTPPTLCAAFGSKDALYRAALENYLRPATSEIRSDQDVGGPAYRIVERFPRNMAVRFASEKTPKGCMIASGSLRSGADNGSAAKVVAALRIDALTRFDAMLRQAVIDREVPDTTDCGSLARFYTAVLQGMSVQAIDGATEDRLNAVVDIALTAWPHPAEQPH